MTEASLPVTERAVEQFVETYLSSLGATIEKNGRRWSVDLPSDAPTELELDGAMLEIAGDPNDVDEQCLAISPTSSLVERMLDEAADRTPIGSLSLTGDRVDIQPPPWLTNASVDIDEHSFTPYYDRRAVCSLFHVGIETVSEYQREELHAVAVDLNDHEERPRLAETYLELTDGEQQELNEGRDLDSEALSEALDVAHTILENDLAPTVRDTRERATRAVESELDEYREYALQRRDELADEIENLTRRVEEATETIDAASEQEERVEALRKRKELQTELDKLRSKLGSLSEQIESGFPEKSKKIRERHAITVRLRPVAVTSISYERGEIDITLRASETTVTRSYGYAVGAGIIEEVSCERCGKQLTAENPLCLDGQRTVGDTCCDV